MSNDDEPNIKPPSLPSSHKEEELERDKEFEFELEFSEDSNYHIQPFNNILKLFEELFKNIKNFFFF